MLAASGPSRRYGKPFYNSLTSFNQGDVDVWVVNADGSGRLTNLTDDNNDIFQKKINADGSVTVTPATDLGPVFSPDATKIAFPSNRLDPPGCTLGDPGCTNDFDIWVMNADGSGTPTNLTSNAVTEVLPEYFPDGKRIAFTRFVGDRDIWVMNTGGTEQRNLTDNMVDPATNAPTHELHATWAPDGTKIVFYSGPGTGSLGIYTATDIWVMNADGSRQTNVTNNGPDVGDIHPNWGIKK